MIKKILIILILILLVFFSFYIKDKKTVLRVGEKEIFLTVLDTRESRTKGLSGKEFLPKNEGILFVFERSDKYGFWMKDMNFSIDIIWLDEDHRVVYIEKNVSPNTFPYVFIPPEKALYVLETNAGFVVENDILVGNILSF